MYELILFLPFITVIARVITNLQYKSTFLKNIFRNLSSSVFID